MCLHQRADSDPLIAPSPMSAVTIGMLVELMAGKSGACHANFQDSTPFRFGEGQRAVDYFGDQVTLLVALLQVI